MADTVLHRCLLQCRFFGVAPSTRQTYQSGFNAFIKFCSQFDITPFPASSLTLEYFCAHASQHVSYKTLKVYLSSIRLAHIEQGLPDPTESATLHLVCRGIRRQQGDNQRTRLPITINLLRTLKEQLRLSSYYTTLEQCMLWAVFTVAFYGFFRASELLQTKWSDIALFSTQMSINLQQSKMDPFRRGITIQIFSTGSSTCPIRAMTLYSKLVKNNNATTLIFRAGRFNPLTIQQLNKAIRHLLQRGEINHKNFASRSFQIGAATTAAAAGLPAWLIKHWDVGVAMLTCHTFAALVRS